MNTIHSDERFRLMQREVALAGDAVDSLRRDHRAEIDNLRLEIEVLRRCLQLLHPEFVGRYEALRDEVLRETDPETS